jgi:hypothetical protein
MTDKNKANQCQPGELYFVDTTDSDFPKSTLTEKLLNGLCLLILAMTGGMLLYTWLTI